ncbi:hypothetical protein ACNF31_13605, partial [Staphylococcus aureus]|uniref:hypothetical protein n=1 Tax=Staphylococcus aureus TaxID=1280 RepID=UPI003A806DBC
MVDIPDAFAACPILNKLIVHAQVIGKKPADIAQQADRNYLVSGGKPASISAETISSFAILLST